MWGSLTLAPINPRRTCAARVTILGLCVYVSLTQHLTFHTIIRATNNTNLLSGGWRSKILSDFLWKCFVAKLERFLLVRSVGHFFTSRKTRMHMNLNHVASVHFVLGETFFASSIIGHWQWVCLQQRYACSVKLLYLLDGRHVNAVILSFDPNKSRV